jgi:hypothetical protein
MMAAQRETVGLAPAGRPPKENRIPENPFPEKAPTLKEAGIDKNLMALAYPPCGTRREAFDVHGRRLCWALRPQNVEARGTAVGIVARREPDGLGHCEGLGSGRRFSCFETPP